MCTPWLHTAMPYNSNAKHSHQYVRSTLTNTRAQWLSNPVGTGLCHALSHLQCVDLAGLIEAISKNIYSREFHSPRLAKIQLCSADVYGKSCTPRLHARRIYTYMHPQVCAFRVRARYEQRQGKGTPNCEYANHGTETVMSIQTGICLDENRKCLDKPGTCLYKPEIVYTFAYMRNQYVKVLSGRRAVCLDELSGQKPLSRQFVQTTRRDFPVVFARALCCREWLFAVVG
jgi:hypothetical protein